VTVAASRQPKFKAGKALKDALNDRQGGPLVGAGMFKPDATIHGVNGCRALCEE
jgi:hypothetical protein